MDGEETEQVCGWSKLSHRLQYYPRFCDVVAIGIAISRGWADQSLIREFQKWRKRHRRLRAA
jgi:hypothetical protein